MTRERTVQREIIMKKLTLCIIALGFGSYAFGDACVSGNTLAFYQGQTGGSCTFSGNGQTYTLGDYSFLAVNVLSAGATTSDFTLQESVGAGGPVVTITPNADLAISGIAATETILLGFDITSGSPDINFSGVNLSTTSSVSGLVTTADVLEEDCYGGLLPGPALLSLGSGGLACLGGGIAAGGDVALTPGLNVGLSVPIPLVGLPTASVDVLKEINLVTVLGSASVSSIGQSFSTVNTGSTAPEPGSGAFLLGGCGLMALALMLRRKNAVSKANHS
jgi:hypothetical protein